MCRCASGSARRDAGWQERSNISFEIRWDAVDAARIGDAEAAQAFAIGSSSTPLQA
jgi:hypothetical protein